MTALNTLLPLAAQLDAFVSGVPATQVYRLLDPISDACRKATVRAHALDVLARVPNLRSLQSSSDWAIGDEGQGYIDWYSVTCTMADGSTVTLNDISLCRDCGEFLRGHDEALAELERANPDREPGALELEHAAALLGIEADDLDTAANAMWELVFCADPEGEDRRLDVLALAEGPQAPDAEARWLATLFDALQGCALIPANRRLAIAGLLDPVLAGHRIEPRPAAEVPASQFPDLRLMFSGAELPGDEEDDGRMYLRLDPFDLKIRRIGDGVSCELYARDGDLEPLAACCALDADACGDEPAARSARGA